MKNTIGFLFSIIFLVQIALAQDSATDQKLNFVVLLDLSDRLLNPQQASFDKEIIKTFFKRFEESARSKFFVRSEDAFHISILPQKNSPLEPIGWEKKLNISLDAMPPAHRAKIAGTFMGQFDELLDELYAKAHFSENNKDYFGVDIWSYFNNRLQYDLKEGYENIVLVLTDGYFDFESYTFTQSKKNRYTSSIFIRKLPEANWQQNAIENDYGLLPASADLKDVRIYVTGLKSKNLSQNEEQKLAFFWEKWLDEMGCQTHQSFPMMNTDQIARRIYEKTGD